MDEEQRFLEAQKLYQKQIADLEAKLAESEEMVNSSFKQNERIKYKLGLITSYNQELQKEIDQLKQQLAEKDEERHEEWLTGKEWKWECDRLKKDQNQTAIAELEKVKAKVRDVSGVLALCEIEVQIDQQIKSLKGEK